MLPGAGTFAFEGEFKEIGAPAFLKPFNGTACVFVSIPAGEGAADGMDATGGTAFGFNETLELILIVLVFSD